jgi:2-polyprenyl-3-methyl-5-hydroxy-6-metoxy-1,4-benzoquinol methylase
MNKARVDKVSSSQVNYDFYQEQWKNAGAYLDKSAGAKWYNYLIDKNLKHIDKKSVKRVIDIGCGVGNKTYFLASKLPDAKVIGSDFSETGIKEARKYFSAKNLKYEVGDASGAKKLGKADLVAFFEVLEHVDSWTQVLGDTIKQTDARYVMIGSPTGKRYEGGIHMGHVLHFKEGEIEEFMQKHGYKTVKAMYAGFPFVSPIFRDLSQAMQKQYAGFVKSEPGTLHAIINTIWYILFRYLSTTKAGNQFVGLFEKV